jgi:two-component system, sensor histidine kinase and response regulator
MLKKLDKQPINIGAFRFSMTYKITLLLAFLVVVTTLSVSTWVFIRFNDELVKREMDDLSTETKLQGIRFKANINELLKDTLFLAGTPPIQGIFRTQGGKVDTIDGTSTEENWRRRLERIFTQMLNAKPYYLQIRYIGVADGGRELLRVDRLGDGGIIRVVSEGQLQQKGDSRYYQNTVQALKGEVVLSDINLNREHGELSLPYTPVIRASTPVFDNNNNIFGMIVINKDITTDFDLLVNVGDKQTNYFITNSEGDYLFHPDGEKAFRFEFGESLLLHDDYPETAIAFSRRQEVNEVFTHTNEKGLKEVVSLRKINYGLLRDAQFLGIVIIKKYSDLLAISKDIREQAYLIFILFIFLVLSVGVIFAKRLSQPIVKITDAVKQFGVENHKIDIPVNVSGEAGILANAFSDMIKNVNDREKILKVEVLERDKAEKKIKAIVENAADVIITINTMGIVLTVNKSGERVFGYTEKEIIGQNIKMLMPEPYRKEHDGYLNDYLHTGQRNIIGTRREAEGKRKNGEIFPLDLSVSEIQLGDDKVYTGIIRDITDLKEVKEKLTSQKKYYEDLIHNMNIPAFVIDANHKVTIWNKACERMSGLLAKDVLGTSDHWKGFYKEKREMLADIIIDNNFESINKLYSKDIGVSFIEGGRSVENWNPMPLKDNPIYVSIDAGPVFDDNGNLIAVIEVIRDITEQKITTDFLREKTEALERSNEQLEQFAYVASHDLQEPLRTVASFTQLLSERYKDKLDDEAHDYISFAVDGAKRMHILIQDLLKLSRIDKKTEAFTEVDLNIVFDSVVENLNASIEESTTTLTKEELPVVTADKSQLVQLFQNIISNAIKYRNPDVKNEINCSATKGSKYWNISIKDNGIGIEPEYYKKIFVIFQRLHTKDKYPGTGIGLALCRKIVERHGGTIWVESKQGKGSTFTFTLPIQNIFLYDNISNDK